ncbi:MAG: glycosyltransferase family 2 protein [Chthoniobacteraceae bacterium]
MRIFGLCLVKNEADIIRLSLRESLRWCDGVFVFDTGSEDATWDLVNEVARTDSRVVPFKQEARVFNDALRAEIFAAFRDRARAGDWWCRLDADEIYADDPRAFLAAVPPARHVVWGLWLQFLFTAEDLPRFAGADDAAPPEMTPELLPRHYQAKGGEARFFRHRDRLAWDGGAWPAHLGLIEPRRIRVKHYQYRSPAQIQRRIDTRRAAAAAGWQHFAHSDDGTWREKLADSAQLTLDRGDGEYAIDAKELTSHLEPGWQRATKRVMHGLGIWP